MCSGSLEFLKKVLLTVELASVLCDVSRCLPEDEKEDVRSLDPEDFTCRLRNNEWYRLFIENDREGYDPLGSEISDCVFRSS